MRVFAPNVRAVSACGFGLSKAATSIGYLSAMGSVAHNIGFVTELWFMLASEAVSLVLAAVVGVLAARGRIHPRSIPQWQALLVFLAGFCLSFTGVLACLPAAASAAVLGVTYGVSSFLLCVTWLEEFAYQEPRESHKNMVAGLCIQMVVVALTSLLPTFLVPVSAMASAVVSCLCHMHVDLLAFGRARRRGEGVSESSRAVGFRNLRARDGACVRGQIRRVVRLPVRARGRGGHLAYVGSRVVVRAHRRRRIHVDPARGGDARHRGRGVGGAAPARPHVGVQGGSARHAGAAVAAAVHGKLLGPFAGTVMIACYDVCGMLFLFFIVDAAHCHRQQSYLLSSVYMGGSNGFLALGLGIGLLLNYLSGDYDISLMTLLAFVAIYPLCIAFVVVMRRSLQGMRRTVQAQSDGVQGAVPEISAPSAPAAPQAAPASREDASRLEGAPASPAPLEPDWEAALQAFAARYRLTKRETEICSYLVRGRSAKRIAEELVISENTVWTHTKNVYAKTKVSGKDDLINLFECEALGGGAS